jgi:putative membrane protein
VGTAGIIRRHEPAVAIGIRLATNLCEEATMKQMILITGLACAVALPALVAGQTARPTGQPPGAAAPTATPAKPSSGSTGQAGGRAAGQGAAGAGTMAATDRAFVMKAAEGGMAEVEMGRLAASKATDADVKQFGQRMVDDHSKANDELKALASQKNLTLPTAPTAKHKADHARLEKLSGAAFDRAYMADMVIDHNKDVAEFQRASTTAKDADLKAWAAKTLPTLKDHQQSAKTINTKVKGGSAAKTPPATPKK